MMKKVTVVRKTCYIVDADDNTEAEFLALEDEHDDMWLEDEYIESVEDM